MVEGECENCGAKIDPKYKFCLKCVQEMKKDNAQVGAVKSNVDIVSELSKINSNLYALRTIQEYILSVDYNAKLVTDPETKRLNVQKIKRQKHE